MNKQRLLATSAAALLLASSGVFACGGENSGKHIGMVTGVNASLNTFTIMDMESRTNITFKANEEIMTAVKKNNGGQVMVNFEETASGDLDALGVTF